MEIDFKKELRKYQEKVNEQLEKYLRKQNCPEKILNQAMEYSLMAGGKRLRPILMLDIYKIFRQDYIECMPYAVAMEMIHNFSLIHDDLPGIDNDDFRHGKQTNHKKFNEATAILAGDGLLNGAYQVIAKSILEEADSKQQKQKILAFKELADATDRMIAGEYVDTEFEGKPISSDYLERGFGR